MNLNAKLEQVAIELGCDIFECVVFKDIPNISVVYAKSRSTKFEGRREVFYFEKDDKIMIATDDKGFIYFMDDDLDRVVRTISIKGSKKLQDASKARLVKTYKSSKTKDDDLDEDITGKYLYYVTKPVKGLKIQGVEIVSTKVYKTADKDTGFFGEITVDKIIEPKTMIKNNLVADEKNNKQVYDLKNGSESLKQQDLKTLLIKENIKDKDDLFKELVEIYDTLDITRQYIIDRKYLPGDSVIFDLDIVTMSRCYMDCKTLSKL